MLELFGLSKEADNRAVGPPVDIKWTRNRKNRFHNLMFLDTAAENLAGISGIYVIWHGGAGSRWLYVGATQDLSKTLDAKIDNPEIERYYDRVGVYVTWSLVKPEYHGGIVRYLTDTMKPEIDNPDAKRYAKEKPIAVFLPG